MPTNKIETVVVFEESIGEQSTPTKKNGDPTYHQVYGEAGLDGHYYA
jgi:hypothetical protein